MVWFRQRRGNGENLRFGVNICILCYAGEQNLPVGGKWSFILSLFENELFNSELVILTASKAGRERG